MPTLTKTQEWLSLQEHFDNIKQYRLRDLFIYRPHRVKNFSLSVADITLDYSKNQLTDEIISQLIMLANKCKLPQAIEHLFSGHPVNFTENRPALHTALRDMTNDAFMLGEQNIKDDVNHALQKMETFTKALHSGQWKGATGEKITDVVNIGIGGSDLGPKVVVEALSAFHVADMNCHFLSNIDPIQLDTLLNKLAPETTVFIVSSKSFTTRETLLNANAAKTWLIKSLGETAIKNHFLAASSNMKACKTFGIPEGNIFQLWDWVGGRYSLWGSTGLIIALAVGFENFKALLAGAHEMDQHFKTVPFEKNMPVLLGLIGIWYINFFKAKTHAILPYTELLQSLPAHLQQLDMESNGKRRRQDGTEVNYETGPIIWGGKGCNGQHAFHQLLHQGTHFIPADFIVPKTSHSTLKEHHDLLVKNCENQTKALLKGKSYHDALNELMKAGLSEQEAKQLAPHKVIPGNNPSNTIYLEAINPKSIGTLLALYEHKVYVQSKIWGINAFDQWGVELGKF